MASAAKARMRATSASRGEVLQLHGLTSSRARDRLLDPDLGRGLSGTRLLRYDARGHGHSSGRPEPADYRWSNLADDLLRLLDRWFPGDLIETRGLERFLAGTNDEGPDHDGRGLRTG